MESHTLKTESSNINNGLKHKKLFSEHQKLMLRLEPVVTRSPTVLVSLPELSGRRLVWTTATAGHRTRTGLARTELAQIFLSLSGCLTSRPAARKNGKVRLLQLQRMLNTASFSAKLRQNALKTATAGQSSGGNWTHDLVLTRSTLYHRASPIVISNAAFPAPKRHS